jgi:nicotinate-nucleotide adenylyltransferase
LNRRIGVFGGTFDPPHLGHLILAAEARYQLDLVRVLWVLTPDPPHKQGIRITAWTIRRELVRAAIEEDDSFELSEVDIARPPPHYAYETLHILRARHPEMELVFLMGGDSLRDLPAWEQPLEFLSACDAVGVMRRPADQVDLPSLEARLPGISSKVRFVDAPLLEISGSEIRRRAAANEPIRYYLPQPVYRLICDWKLYRQAEDPIRTG